MPARSSITWVPILIQRDRLVWNEDAPNFNPDRWLSDSDIPATPATHPSAFMPFNMGPRIVSLKLCIAIDVLLIFVQSISAVYLFQCLGQQLAYVQASYVWSRILQRFPTLEQAMDMQPASSKPPMEWSTFNDKSRHATETIWPDASITLRIRVRIIAWIPLPNSHIDNLSCYTYSSFREDFGSVLNLRKYSLRVPMIISMSTENIYGRQDGEQIAAMRS